MSESDSRVISPENLPTVVGVIFVLVLFSIGMNFYAFARMNQLAVSSAALTGTAVVTDVKGDGAINGKIDGLRADLDALATKVGAMAPADPATAADAAHGE